MPSPINYSVTLSPATIEHGCVSHMLFDPRAIKTTITASSFAALEAEVRVQARAGFPTEAVSVYVDRPRGQRKPNGFDAATRAFQTIRNDQPAAQAA